VVRSVWHTSLIETIVGDRFEGVWTGSRLSERFAEITAHSPLVVIDLHTIGLLRL